MTDPCEGSHDGKHRPIRKMGSSTGYICKCCRKEIENVSNGRKEDPRIEEREN